jgi:aspartyl-tRNA(Asn)/glutamyl-tRNA(Gln) amidotransferase subunit A
MIKSSSKLPVLTLKRASWLLASGKITSEELCTYCHNLAVAGEEQWQLNAFTKLIPLSELLQEARVSDNRRRRGGDVSPLEGIPVSIKANLAVASQPLTAASRVLRDEDPCGYNADVVSKLLDAGAILLGINNMDEFGMGSLGTNIQPSLEASITRNPVPYIRHLKEIVPMDNDLRLADFIRMSVDSIMEAHADAFAKEDGNPIRSAGGSSCGSGASVAHGSSLASLGTDTGGSVRLPAAWCGVVGLKPSYGILSRYGVVSYASSLDTVGILAPTIDCATTVFTLLAQRKGDDSRDSTASFYDSSASLTTRENGDSSQPLAGIKVGIPQAFSVAECPKSIRDAWSNGVRSLVANGAIVETISTDEISPEMIKKSLAAYYVLASAEASSNLSRYDGVRYGPTALPDVSATESDMTPLQTLYAATRSQGFGLEVVRRILCGTFVLSSDRFHTHYEAAAKLRAALTQQLCSSLKQVDVLLFPTALTLPCSLDKLPDSTEMFANDVMTVPASLAGLPAVSVPVVSEGSTDEWASIGLQIVGSRLDERTLLEVAKIIEQVGQ